ncbi:MAG TPA: ABC transporter ATP-binding protein [Ilumatobacter sp.]|nr:ABC transporter ATP-binding protein [Ilumatobacter sp.]
MQALTDVSLEVPQGQTVGIVGESGSGKSTLGRAILGLTAIQSGSIRFREQEIAHLQFRERRTLSRHIQAVFQDPYGSLSPTRTVGQSLAEPILVHEGRRAGDVGPRTTQMLEQIGFDATIASRYPAQLSGGQRQRVAIARALMTTPDLVVCDEPTSALDLSVQAQILNLLKRMQAASGVSYIFISHDLGVVRYLADHVVVLYRGEIVERGTTEKVYEDPDHDYTKKLLSAISAPRRASCGLADSKR